MFIQERRISIGMFQDVGIYPLTDDCKGGRKGGKKKKRKEVLPRPAQQNNNDKRSRYYFGLLAKGNFGRGDYYGTVTFSDANKPKTPEEAKIIFQKKFIRKVRELYKKANKDLKYLFVMEYQEDEVGNELKRVHFHFLMTSGVSRDDIEECWSVGRGKKKEKIGRTNLRIIQPDSDGITALVNYLKKDARWKKGVKTWSSSRNIERPILVTNNSKYSIRKVEKLALSNDHGQEEFAKQYPDFWITSIKPVFNELKGWHIYLEMIRKDGDGS